VPLHGLRWGVDGGFAEKRNRRNVDEHAVDEHRSESNREFAGVVGHS
jgi:hypothetical protein